MGTETKPMTQSMDDQSDNSSIYVASASSRLFDNHHYGFRADARCVGLAAVAFPGMEKKDVLLSLSQSGNLYCVSDAEAMAPPSTF